MPKFLLSRIGLAAFLPMLIVVPPARADAEDALLLTGGINVMHDDNVSRQPSGAAEADIISVSTLGIKINKPYSLQRFELDARLADHRYQTFDEKNFTALDYMAAWRWSVTPYLHGNLSSERLEVSNSSNDNPQPGTHTDERQRFDGVLEVSGSWRVLGGVTQSRRSNSEATGSEGDSRLNAAEAGLRYDFPSGSSLGYLRRESHGDEFSQAQANSGTLRFDQQDDELRLIWSITEKTTIDTRVARLVRSYADDDSRGYDGLVGNINVNWHITSKTSLMAGVGHELSGYQSSDSRFVRTDRFTLSPLWQISEKTVLRARYDYARRAYQGGTSDRIDILQTAMLALEWKALRALTVSASLQHDRRGSNLPGVDFKSTQAGIAAQLAF